MNLADKFLFYISALCLTVVIVIWCGAGVKKAVDVIIKPLRPQVYTIPDNGVKVVEFPDGKWAFLHDRNGDLLYIPELKSTKEN